MHANDNVEPALDKELESKVLPGPGILLSRGLLYLIGAALVSLGIWSCLTEIDTIVSTTGSLVVDGEPLHVTTAERGMVLKVEVKVGEDVVKGATLLEIDSYAYSRDIEALDAELQALATEEERYKEAASNILRSAELTKQQLSLADESKTIIARQAETFKTLSEEEVFSSLEAQQKERELLEADSRVARLMVELNQQKTEWSQNLLRAKEIAAKRSALKARIERLTEARRRTVITAPVSGTVAALGVKHPGSMLSPDAPAAVIFPEGLPLRALVKIPNASMRHVSEGMDARVRFEAYPHQDFGHIEGRILKIEPGVGEEGAYSAWISLDNEMIEGPRGKERLRAGLKLNADVIVDRKSLAQVLLSPFTKLAGPISVEE
jgi:multidrug resistance efflux pump